MTGATSEAGTAYFLKEMFFSLISWDENFTLISLC
jgi:hypothetical protein